MYLVLETADEYRQGEEQLLAKELGHLGWVRNILEGKAEQERVLLSSKDYVILPDFKFSVMT